MTLWRERITVSEAKESRLPMIGQPFDLPTYDWLSIQLTLVIVYFLRSESIVNL